MALTYKNTIVIAAWCGTGKTYICDNTDISSVEIEYWKYKDNKKQYVKDVNEAIGSVDYIFISTDPENLKLLNKSNIKVTLVYPKNELRSEYLDRYIKRDSPCEFIGTFMKYWDIWIDELKTQYDCNHIVLDKGKYLIDVLPNIIF